MLLAFIVPSLVGLLVLTTMIAAVNMAGEVDKPATNELNRYLEKTKGI